MTTAYKSRDGKSLLWLLEITWKRRKGRPREYVGICSGGALHVLAFHQHIYRSLKVPGSWVDFKLRTIAECRQLAPKLCADLRAQDASGRVQKEDFK
jgi:hypothetical protein